MRQGVLRTADFWAGMVLVVFGLICVREASSIFVPVALTDILGPMAFPLGLSALVAILGGLIVVRSVVLGAERPDPGDLGTMTMLVAAFIVYILLFMPLGFITSTTLFLAFQFWYLGERRHWVTLVVSVGVTLVIYLGFATGLNVSLPQGPLGF